MQLAHGVHALNLQHCGNSGTQGCKNIRSGGDTAGADFDGKGAFLYLCGLSVFQTSSTVQSIDLIRT